MGEAEANAGSNDGVALLIIDMLNTLDFPQAERMIEAAEAAGDRVLALRAAADARGTPVVYVNDNYGHWHSDRSRIVDLCTSEDSAGRALAEKLKPREDDYFVMKPQFSGFYATTLPALLPRIGARRLILTGVATDICVLFTAADAHMREYDLWIPADTVASDDRQRTDWALQIMRNAMKAETRPTAELTIEGWTESLSQ